MKQIITEKGFTSTKGAKHGNGKDTKKFERIANHIQFLKAEINVVAATSTAADTPITAVMARLQVDIEEEKEENEGRPRCFSGEGETFHQFFEYQKTDFDT